MRSSVSRSAMLLAGLLSACAPGVGQDLAGEGAEQADVLDGEASTDKAVLFVRARSTLAGDTVCSAVLIAPDLALTAAHCVHPRYTGAGVKFSLGPDGSYSSRDLDSGQWMRVDHVDMHPDFDAEQVARGHDIAVLKLHASYTGAAPKPIAPWALPEAWRTPDWFTTHPVDARVVGYGVATDNHSAPQGKRREAVVPLRSMRDQLVQVGGKGASQGCYGDSGGPALLRYADEERVFALASIVAGGNCETGNYSTRIDANWDFLRSVLGDLIPAVLEPTPADFPGTEPLVEPTPPVEPTPQPQPEPTPEPQPAAP